MAGDAVRLREDLTFDLERAVAPVSAAPVPVPEEAPPNASLDRCFEKYGLCSTENCCGERNYRMCLSVAFCSLCTAVQIWSFTNRIPRWTCVAVGVVLSGAAIASLVFESISETETVRFGSTLRTLTLIGFILLVALSRCATREERTSETANTSGDCWTSIFCGPCAICQLFVYHGIAKRYQSPFDYFVRSTEGAVVR